MFSGAVADSIISVEEGNAFIGECRFLRALTYHEMLIHFARPYRDGNGDEPGLPIILTGSNTPESVLANSGEERATVAQTYARILEDLDFAEANLPESRGDAALSVVRATSGAAVAMKTRVFLHMGEWDDVITEANKIVSTAAPFTGGGLFIDSISCWTLGG